MKDPSENDQATEDQDATVTTEEAPPIPAAEELIAEEATVSDAIDDARPDDEAEPEQEDDPIADRGDAMAAQAEDAEAPAVTAGLPLYQCHKTVEAFKITNMESMSNGDIRLIGAGGVHSVVVGPAYVDKHRPQEGGYFVKYHDGYRSWSPAAAFEQGYTLFGG